MAAHNQWPDPTEGCILQDGTRSMEANLAMGSHKITGVADPTSAQEAATKNYVDTHTAAAFYDTIIDAGGGGSYTSAAAAFTAVGANKKYLWVGGAYSEVNDVSVPVGAEVSTLGTVAVTMAAGKRFLAVDDGATPNASRVTGHIKVSGPGTSPNGELVRVNGTGRRWGGCVLEINPTPPANPLTADWYPIVCKGSDSESNLYVHDIAVDAGASYCNLINNITSGCDGMVVYLDARDISLTNGATRRVMSQQAGTGVHITVNAHSISTNATVVNCAGATQSKVDGLVYGSGAAVIGGSTNDIFDVLINGTQTVPALAHTHAGAANGAKLTQANTHESADTDSAQASIHHTIETSVLPANLFIAACGSSKKVSAADHVHKLPSAYDVGADATGTAQGLITSHDHSGTTSGPQLIQANTHGSADTDTSGTSIHHTIGTGATQAAAGNHSHAIGDLTDVAAYGAGDIGSVATIVAGSIGGQSVEWVPPSPLPGGQSLYDVVVDAAGTGDYTSIGAAFNAEGGGKSYFIARGSYSELDNIAVPGGAGTFIHWAGVQITLADTKKFYASAAISTMEGSLTIYGGSGVSAYSRFFEACKDDLRWGACDIHLRYIPATSTATTALIPFQIGCRNNDISLEFSGSINCGGKEILGFYINSASAAASTGSKFKLRLKDLIVSNTGGTPVAVYCETSLACIYDVSVTGCSGFTTGLFLSSGTDYCSVAGCVYNCGTELINSGTGNSVSGLATG